MIRDGLLVFREPNRLHPLLPAILATSGIPIKSDSVKFTEIGLEADARPTATSWWGEKVEIRLHPDDGGTSVVEIRSDHHGPSFFKDHDNVARIRHSFRRTMRTLGVTVAWVRPRLPN